MSYIKWQKETGTDESANVIMKGYEPILTERNEKVKPVKEFFTEAAELEKYKHLL